MLKTWTFELLDYIFLNVRVHRRWFSWQDLILKNILILHKNGKKPYYPNRNAVEATYGVSFMPYWLKRLENLQTPKKVPKILCYVFKELELN